MLSRVFRFGEFTLDMDRYQLLRRGSAVKLENLPLQLLMLLVNRKGQLVTRREIEEELWGKDVFVDIEQGINTAIRKIRQVLRDRPEQPRYLQTLVGRGYRFIDVEVVEGALPGPNPAISAPEADSGSATLEQLGQAILSAAGLDNILPNLPHFAPFAQAQSMDNQESFRQEQVPRAQHLSPERG